MHDATASGTDVRIYRVLAASARHPSEGGHRTIAALVTVREQPPRLEGRHLRISLGQPPGPTNYAVLLITWPPGGGTPMRVHDSFWSIESALDGGLQVRKFFTALTRSVQPVPKDTGPLGIGDHTTFSDRNHAHRRCKLSARQPARSSLVCGALEVYCPYRKSSAGRRNDTLQRVVLELTSL